MKKIIKVLKFIIIMCCLFIYVIFVIFCVGLFFELNEKPPGTYDKIKNFNMKITDCSDTDLFEKVAAAARKKIPASKGYFMADADMWIDGNGNVTIIDLYYYSKDTKYELMKAHCTLDEKDNTLWKLEHIEYYKNTDTGPINYRSDGCEKILLQSYNEVKENFVRNKSTEEFFVSLSYNGNMYVMEMQVSENGRYKLVKLDEKYDGIWKSTNNEDIEFLPYPFPIK